MPSPSRTGQPRIGLLLQHLLAFLPKGKAMPRTTIRESSQLPSILLACAGLALAFPLVHDAIDRRIFTAESIFNSPITTVLAVLGVGMAGVLLWDIVSSRRQG
jgi:hypothetical protein